MKKIALFTVFACIMVILQGCAKDMPTEENKEAVQENSNAYHKIDAKKAKEMMDAGKVTIVDVRTQQEYRENLYRMPSLYRMKRLRTKRRTSFRIRMLF